MGDTSISEKIDFAKIRQEMMEKRALREGGIEFSIIVLTL